MPATLQPIQTAYKGFRFRSRLEARWAVFFDAIDLRWEYEVEGFELPSGAKYLPDFKVFTPQGEPMWVEIKPEGTTHEAKFDEFKELLDYGQRVWLAQGDPVSHLENSQICPRCGVSHPFDPWEQNPLWEHCWFCDTETPGGGGHPTRTDGLMGCRYKPHKGMIVTESLAAKRLLRRLDTAANQARSARFEHGDKP